MALRWLGAHVEEEREHGRRLAIRPLHPAESLVLHSYWLNHRGPPPSLRASQPAVGVLISHALRASFIDSAGHWLERRVGWWWARCCSLLRQWQSAQRVSAGSSRRFASRPLDSLSYATFAPRRPLAFHNTCSNNSIPSKHLT